MSLRKCVPLLFFVLTLGVSLAQARPAGSSVVPVGILAVQPTHVPPSMEKRANQPVLLQIAFGSGFVVREDGYVITALHVVKKAETRLAEIEASIKEIVVWVNMPAGLYREAEVVGTDERNDLAVLKIKQLKGVGTLRAMRLSSIAPAEGTEVWAAGYPDSDGGMLIETSGKFSSEGAPDAATRDVITGGRTLWLANITVENGTSGGPIYLRDGSVVGVIVTRSADEAVAGFVPAQRVLDLLAKNGVADRNHSRSLLSAGRSHQ